MPSLSADALHVCLALQHGLGHGSFTRLMARFGSADAVYRAAAADLAQTRIRPEALASILKGPDARACEDLARRCARLGIRVLLPRRPGYPDPLAALAVPPPLLFARGEWLPRDARAAALVGTRHPSAYGSQAAFALGKGLAEAGIAVVSGFAMGIDAAAHAGALSGGGRTVAVLGCGLDIDYPRAHRALRERILRQGVLLSEFPPGTEPRPPHFPRRNRILSALARAVVVVEAGNRSGALITAALARMQGKPLLAVPGSMFSPASAGPHRLLKSGARVAESAADVAACVDGELGVPQPQPPAAAPRRPPKADPVHPDPVLDLWQGEEVCGLDRLLARAEATGLCRPAQPASLLPSLLRLELRGVIRRLPGPSFRRLQPDFSRP